MKTPDSGGGSSDSEKTPSEPESHEPSQKGGGGRLVTGVLLLVCLALAVGLVLSVRDSAGVKARLELSKEIGALYLEGATQLEKGDHAGARISFTQALEKTREYQFNTPDSYMEALSNEIDFILKKPAIARGESGLRAQRAADFRKLAKELKPADIYAQLGDRAADILDEHVKNMRPEDIAALAPETVGKLTDRMISELDEKELVQRLGKKLDTVFQQRLAGMTLNGLRTWLQGRLEELVRGEVERRKYDPAAMNKLLGERRTDVVRSFLLEAKAEELAELLEKRFDDLERVMAEKMVGRQERITLDDGQVWEGQVLHDGPLNIRFLRNDGKSYMIPKSRISKREKLLQPKEEKKEPEKPSEPEKDE
jgi:hypothetical protein